MRVHTIELLGKKYPMCFSWTASEELDEAFGGLDKMAEELDSGQTSRVLRAADKVLAILMNAGRVYAQACGEEVPELPPCRPADLLEATDKDLLRKIISTISGDSAREVEVEEKNGTAAPDGQAGHGSTTTAQGQD